MCFREEPMRVVEICSGAASSEMIATSAKREFTALIDDYEVHH